MSLSKIRVVEVKRRTGNKYYVMYKKEKLSGPWKTGEQAFEASKEWVVPKLSYREM